MGAYTGGTFSGCSFDSERNTGLSAAGTGTLAEGVTGVESATVLSNICRDYYGGHQLTETEAKAPTCTEAGSSAYWTCSNCGKLFADADAATEITLEDTVIAATGHNYVNGVCTVCGAKKPSSPGSGSSSSFTTETVTNNDGSTTTVTNTTLAPSTETTRFPVGSKEVVGDQRTAP